MSNSTELNETVSLQICTLSYAENEYNNQVSCDSAVILLLVEQNQLVDIYVNPDWQDFARPTDREFIEAILCDFKERASVSPNALFKQAQAISIGPLLTHETRQCLRSDPFLFDLIQRMVKIG